MLLMQSRFRSKVLWLSIATQVLAILITLNVIDIAESEVIKTVLVSVCELFVTFGILNNPTDANNL